MKGTAIRITVFAVAVAALVLLLDRRPGWPQLPTSLDAPLTVTAVEDVALLALWVAACALAVGLLARTAATATAATRTPQPDPLLGQRRPFGSGPNQRSRPTVRPADPVYTVATPTRPAPPAAQPAADQPPALSSGGGDPSVAIALLGPPLIEGVEQPRRAATKELIAYLALNREATRDELLEAIWPGQDPRRTRARLWQSVSEAGRALGPAFVRDRDRYHLDRHRLRLDIDELDRLLASADAADDPTTERTALEDALKLWRGDALAGTDYQWAEGAIRHLQATHIDLLERTARARLDAGDASAALEAAERGIAIEELHEGLWRIALQAESDLGRREAINQRYETLRRLLDERFGLQPDRATTTLYRQLLGQG